MSTHSQPHPQASPQASPQPNGAGRPPLPRGDRPGPSSLCPTRRFLTTLPTAFQHRAIGPQVTGPATLFPQVTAGCPSSQATSWERSCHCPTQGITLHLPPFIKAYDLQPVPLFVTGIPHPPTGHPGLRASGRPASAHACGDRPNR